jgi:hypothetical protein
MTESKSRREVRRYEVRRVQKWSRQSSGGVEDTLEAAIARAERMGGDTDEHYIRIREYELSGMPGLPAVRPDRLLTLREAIEEAL